MNNEDVKQLDLLSLFHYIVGGIMALFSCMPFMHVFMGIMMISGEFFGETDGSAPPPGFGWMFVIMGSTFIILGWITAILIIIAGKKLKARKHRMFCMIIAGIECMFMPIGTVLGVFTIIALCKDSIIGLFEQPANQNTPDTLSS